jgi:transposase
MHKNRYRVSDELWGKIVPLLPKHVNTHRFGGGRPRANDRKCMDGIFFVLRTGCQWRMLPKDFGPWPTVYYYYRTWRRDGTLQKIHDALRQKVRVQAGRKSSPSAAIIDSQSVKTAEKGGRVATMLARRSTGASDTSS